MFRGMLLVIAFPRNLAKRLCAKRRQTGSQSGLSANANRPMFDVVDTRMDSDYLE